MPTCSKCGKRDAIVRQRHSGLDLCARCFCRYFEKRILKANRDFELLRRGDVVAVGVSGGKDSSAMLYVLNRLAKKIGNIQIRPILIDEGISGYRAKAKKKAEQLCKKLGFKLAVVRFDRTLGKTLDKMLKQRDKLGLNHGACTYCGVFRKKLLNETALKLKANKLAIGHNADDTGQTFLMNLLRNDTERLKRLGAKSGVREQERFVRRIKPLIYCTEKECALYCTIKGLPFYLGSCPYASEAFRGIVKDFLNEAEEKYPGTKFKLLNAFLAIQKQLDKEDGKAGLCERCGNHTSGKVCKACKLLEELKS